MADKCDMCGKELGDKKVERSGKKFCNDKHMKEYGKAHPSENPNTCEFC